jgi:hypothetical protein
MVLNKQTTQITLPSEKEIKNLPLRGIVAYAFRCVARVYPIFLLTSDHPYAQEHEESLNHAIQIVSSYAKGEEVESSLAHISAKKATKAAESAKDLPTGLQASFAASSIVEAAYSVYAAASELSSNNAIVAKAFMVTSNGKTVEETLKFVRAEHAANFAARGAAFSANATPAASDLIVNDFKKLISLNLGIYPEVGNPIDPSENGPLGSLWPNGTPRWYAVDQKHPFYEEMLQFYVSTISMKALLWSSMVDKHVRSGIKPTIVETTDGPKPSFIIELPDLGLETHLIQSKCADECIMNCSTTVDYLLGKNSKPVQLFFTVRPNILQIPDKKEIKGELEAHLGPSLEMIACYIVGAGL